MKLEEIEKVIHLFENANISSLEVEDDGVKIKLTKEMTPVLVNSENLVSKPVTETKETANEVSETKNTIKSPLVGTYHQAPFQDAKPFVSVGQRVSKGDKLCIIEAMKVMNEIKSEKDGVIKEILVEEGDMVEFDQPLFVLGD
jgi:acetyl-CoA carboxylase biotin carboxyl carrier protein